MTIEGVDYAWGRPNPAELAHAGKKFACRYLSYNITGKNLTRTEAGVLSRAGLSVVCGWETVPDAALGGFDLGRRHALDAIRQALNCGAPYNPVIYFAVDFDATDAQLSGVGQYFRGIATVIPVERIGCYGGYRTVDFLWRNGYATYLWQTFAWSRYWLSESGVWSVERPAESDGKWVTRWHDRAAIRQYKNGVIIDGADCDLDRGMVDDFGQWRIEATMALEEKLTPYNGQDITLGVAVSQILARTNLLANVINIPARLDAILAAIADFEAPETVASPDVVTALQDLRAEVTKIPDAVSDEIAHRVAD